MPLNLFLLIKKKFVVIGLIDDSVFCLFFLLNAFFLFSFFLFRCSCAGPYGHDLLSISDEDAELIERLLIDKHEILRPGFVRLSIPYYWNDSLVQDVIKAILFVADFGYLFLEDYVYYTDSGVFV